MEKILKILKKFKNRKILVIGDIMLDKYILGDVHRISPEAPVQVVNVNKEKYIPGGAGNVCNNVASLGCTAYICGVIGDDYQGGLLLSCFNNQKINTEMVFKDQSRKTTEKVRIVSHGQQLLRIDYENILSNNIEPDVIKMLDDRINDFDIVIVSDYAKGFITEAIMRKIINGRKTIIDPKPANKDLYRGAYLITPNLKEASKMSSINIEGEDSIYHMGDKLKRDLNSHILITCGDRGMYLFDKDGNVIKLPAKAQEVYDVTGAGDTVIAALSVAMAAGATIKESALIANYAAGIVVGKFGTATTTIEEIRNIIKYEQSRISG